MRLEQRSFLRRAEFGSVQTCSAGAVTDRVPTNASILAWRAPPSGAESSCSGPAEQGRNSMRQGSIVFLLWRKRWLRARTNEPSRDGRLHSLTFIAGKLQSSWLSRAKSGAAAFLSDAKSVGAWRQASGQLTDSGF